MAGSWAWRLASSARWCELMKRKSRARWRRRQTWHPADLLPLSSLESGKWSAGCVSCAAPTCLSSSFSACTVPSSRHASALSWWARTYAVGQQHERAALSVWPGSVAHAPWLVPQPRLVLCGVQGVALSCEHVWQLSRPKPGSPLSRGHVQATLSCGRSLSAPCPALPRTSASSARAASLSTPRLHDRKEIAHMDTHNFSFIQVA